MFENITHSFSTIINGIRGKKVLTNEDLEKACQEIRVALLEADVALPVVRDFIAQLKTKFVGQEVIRNVRPADMIVKIVNDELIELLGNEVGDINLEAKPSLILMMGLQGSGKTTTSAKLALRLKNKFLKKVLLVSLDVYRPVAQEQLEILAKRNAMDSLEIIKDQKPLDICRRALELKNSYDVIIFDTAGRLTVDEAMMAELCAIRDTVKPTESILVADALSGQDAVNTAREFNEKVGVNSVVLSRIDGDGRGGAALGIRAVTHCPLRYIGTGEKITDFDIFHPERMASRILDRGDIVSLVEKAEEVVKKEDAEKIGKKIKNGSFDFNDLLQQFEMMKKFGGLSSILGFLPGLGNLKDKLVNQGLDDGSIKKQEAIILSMTKQERENPDILNSSRKNRIARGSGTKIQDVNSLLKKFGDMRSMMQKFGNMDGGTLKSMMNSLKNNGSNPFGGFGGFGGGGFGGGWN